MVGRASPAVVRARHSSSAGEMRRSFLALTLLLVPAIAEGRARRLALVVGHNIGAAGEVPLKYAEADAARLAQVLGEVGAFDDVRTHAGVSASDLGTAIDRARLKPLSSVSPALSSRNRNSTGSAFAAAASSSMNDSCANVICGPFGSRRLPVRKGVSCTSGSATTCPDVRRFGMVYMSEGALALPAAGFGRRIPMSCAMRTVSGSL